MVNILLLTLAVCLGIVATRLLLNSNVLDQRIDGMNDLSDADLIANFIENIDSNEEYSYKCFREKMIISAMRHRLKNRKRAPVLNLIVNKARIAKTQQGG